MRFLFLMSVIALSLFYAFPFFDEMFFVKLHKLLSLFFDEMFFVKLPQIVFYLLGKTYPLTNLLTPFVDTHQLTNFLTPFGYTYPLTNFLTPFVDTHPLTNFLTPFGNAYPLTNFLTPFSNFLISFAKFLFTNTLIVFDE